MPPADVYISIDVEADGPIPGPYSMLSFGLAVAGSFDGSSFTESDPAAETFYRELAPISEQYDPDALAVSGLDRDLLVRTGADPAASMTSAASWVRTVSGRRRAVAVAYPLPYDWMWLYWYFVRFAEGGSPFGFSRALDIKTMYARAAGVTVGEATKRNMPAAILSSRPHTHNALDDAIEQAELFQRLFQWRAVGGGEAAGSTG
jgi:hypothetical protein